jgi:hypothetical protein
VKTPSDCCTIAEKEGCDRTSRRDVSMYDHVVAKLNILGSITSRCATIALPCSSIQGAFATFVFLLNLCLRKCHSNELMDCYECKSSTRCKSDLTAVEASSTLL